MNMIAQDTIQTEQKTKVSPLTFDNNDLPEPTPEMLESLQKEFDALLEEVRADIGERDAKYIRKIVRTQRIFEISGRGLIHFSFTPIPFALGVLSLGVAKIIENMEIGHNVMHGQYDWMNDPKLHSTSYEWDTACDADSWRKTHNYEHHTYTNILGKDRDYGYGILRMSEDESWHPLRRFQFAYYVLLSVFFQWGVALHEMEFEKVVRKEVTWKSRIPFYKTFAKKGFRQIFKDYIFFPLLAGPFFLKVLLGNMLANLIRNLWASTVIFCGHFTEGSKTFPVEVCENETRGHWYYRQLLGSGNFTGGKWLHILSGHLSYQIEHHLFPDIPAHRYAEMSPRVQEICEKHGLPYNTGTFWSQYKTVLKRIIRFSRKPKDSNVEGQLVAA
ncbi:fatty acid desaturase [Oleiphilus messinensis]|uniref:Fatty acid desaturase n=1 Tax=Oleiphilus messinensis TaxID=141451 RepID=A0A1Y0I7D0_9GAMM|nr:acyl-CoA desaturase [Oleiphilus messinensis]ARU55344.1 fatty acid desaturase [Oleiphilus messinensis]